MPKYPPDVAISELFCCVRLMIIDAELTSIPVDDDLLARAHAASNLALLNHPWLAHVIPATGNYEPDEHNNERKWYTGIEQRGSTWHAVVRCGNIEKSMDLGCAVFEEACKVIVTPRECGDVIFDFNLGEFACSIVFTTDDIAEIRNHELGQ